MTIAVTVVVTLVLLRWVAPEILGAVLAKSVEKYRKDLERELENFKIATQAAYNAQLAYAQHQLDRRADEHRIRFARLHEQRAVVIQSLYPGIDRFNRSVRSMLQVIDSDQDKPPGWDAAVDAYQALVPVYYENAVWLDEKTCKLINGIIDLLLVPIRELSVVKGRNPGDLQRAVDKAHRIINDLVPQARELLDQRLRQILAGEADEEDPPSSRARSDTRDAT